VSSPVRAYKSIGMLGMHAYVPVPFQVCGTHHVLSLPILPCHAMPACAGDSVLYGKFDGMSIDYDGLPHVLIRDDDVLLTWQGAAMTEAAVQTVRDR